MTFLKKYKKNLIYLGILAVFFLLYFTLRNSKKPMETLCKNALLPFEQWLGRLCANVSFSVSELLYILLIIWVLVALVITIVRIVKKKGWKEAIFKFLLFLVSVAATVYALFCLLWGTFYQTESFTEKSGLTAEGGTREELVEVLQYFVDQTNAYAGKVSRDENGVFNVDRDQIIKESDVCYEGITQIYGFLSKDEVAPKPFFFSKVLSYLDFTAYYFPMTGETNLNMDSPSYSLPMTICHEKAHQRGVASEKECNFIGILAATTCKSDIYKYSGYISGYNYLANALYREDPQQWEAMYDQLCEEAKADLHYANAYWKQFEGTVQDVSNAVYDDFLKSNGDTNGMKSYGLVVDLLLAYYA